MTTPWYARVATTAGRPAVLTATLIMSMPGEYHVAKLAGWTDPWAYGMPFSLSAYAGIAAVVSATRPAGARGRLSATLGAALAIVLALAAQVVAHLVATGHMNGDQAWLIAATSMVPPAVLAHLLHLAATPGSDAPSTPVGEPVTPVDGPLAGEVTRADAPVTVPVEQLVTPVIPPAPTAPPALPAPAAPVQPAITPAPAQRPAPQPAATTPRRQYDDPALDAIRALYETGTRPGTEMMRNAVEQATGARPGPTTCRQSLRKAIEAQEPHLADYPAAPITLPKRRTA